MQGRRYLEQTEYLITTNFALLYNIFIRNYLSFSGFRAFAQYFFQIAFFLPYCFCLFVCLFICLFSVLFLCIFSVLCFVCVFVLAF